MSDNQINKLFAIVEALAKEVKEMKEAVNRVVANSDVVLAGYREHGTAIESIHRTVEKISMRCPMLKTETDEFKKVAAE